MSQNSTKPKTRSLEVTLDIAATPERVWQALTDPAELTNWFPLTADVRPGVGGVFTFGWGPGLEGRCPIRVWEPHRHLQTGWLDSGDALVFEAEPLASVVDYFIEGRGGTTVLRLVHSGIGDGEAWDEEYESLNRGWTIELGNLKHYLERHAGKTRRVAWARQPIDMPIADAWKRLTNGGGPIAKGSLDALSVGKRYALTLSSGDTLEGVVGVLNPPRDFVGTVENLEGALFRISIESCFAQPEVGFWLSSWTVDPADAERTQHRFARALRSAFE